MKAGQLRHLVTIERPIESLSDYGETVVNWDEFATVNASVSPLTANETFRAQQVQFGVTHKVAMRYLPGLDSTMRIVFGNRVLHIVSIINADGRNIQLELLCRE